MILNTKALNEMVRKFSVETRDRGLLPGCQEQYLLLHADLLLSHHSKDGALYSSVSSLFNDSLEIIKLNLF